jgi:hypothetical protein
MSSIPVSPLFSLDYKSDGRPRARSFQTRRTTRTTRSAALTNENATARPTRTAAARTKPPSKDAGAAGASRATGTTAASRAKAAAAAAAAAAPPPGKADGKAEGKVDATAPKRKREALGEVAVVNGKNKPAAPAAGKGKGKDVAPVLEKAEKKVFDGVVLKAKVSASTVIVGSSSAVPAPTAAAARSFRFGAAAAAAPSTRRATRSTIAVAKDEPDVPEAPAPAERAVLEDVKEEAEDYAEPELRKSDHMEIDAPAARRASARKPASARRAPARGRKPAPVPEADEEDAEDHRKPKKPRTSSEAGDLERRQVEDALVVAADEEETAFVARRELVLGEVEHDPNGPDWDDLDEEDKDDPQMVSEYVIEIFEYLKDVEVSVGFCGAR